MAESVICDHCGKIETKSREVDDYDMGDMEGWLELNYKMDYYHFCKLTCLIKWAAEESYNEQEASTS